jgi:hypothetical protein
MVLKAEVGRSEHEETQSRTTSLADSESRRSIHAYPFRSQRVLFSRGGCDRHPAVQSLPQGAGSGRSRFG